MQSRSLGSDYWRIAIAALRVVPQGVVRLDTFTEADLPR